MLNPDNSTNKSNLIYIIAIPVDEFYPDTQNSNEQDDTFHELMEFLEELKGMEDVRPELIHSFNLRQTAINSKLI